jgi:hypothetical protein
MLALRPVVRLLSVLALLGAAEGHSRADEASPRTARVAAGAEPTAFVHIDANSRVVLETKIGWPSSSSPYSEPVIVCAAPCDALIPLGRPYEVNDPHLGHLGLKLKAKPGERVDLRLSPGSPVAYASGVGLAVAGGLAIATGTIALAFAGSSPSTGGGLSVAEKVGLFSDLGGVIALPLGMLMALYWAPDVKQSVSRPRLAPPERAETAWLRAPTWRESTRTASPGPRLAFPIVFRSF